MSKHNVKCNELYRKPAYHLVPFFPGGLIHVTELPYAVSHGDFIRNTHQFFCRHAKHHIVQVFDMFYHFILHGSRQGKRPPMHFTSSLAYLFSASRWRRIVGFGIPKAREAAFRPIPSSIAARQHFMVCDDHVDFPHPLEKRRKHAIINAPTLLNTFIFKRSQCRTTKAPMSYHRYDIGTPRWYDTGYFVRHCFADHQH